MFQYQFNKDYKYIGSDQDPLGVTVPDMSIGIAQLLANHTRGIGVNVKQYQGMYFEDEEIPQISDLNDLVERKKALRERYKQIDDQIKEELNKKRLDVEKQKKEAENAKKVSDKGSEDAGE